MSAAGQPACSPAALIRHGGVDHYNTDVKRFYGAKVQKMSLRTAAIEQNRFQVLSKRCKGRTWPPAVWKEDHRIFGLIRQTAPLVRARIRCRLRQITLASC